MKVRIIIFIVLFLSIIVFFSCEKEKSYVNEKMGENVTTNQPKEELSPSPKSETESKDVSKQKLEGSKNEDLKISERLVIKTGKVSIEVEKYDESEK
ncbi:MAG: hypothetical protein N2490_03810, partial [Ignavibacteria bacterium]|nr:hypothetical protein [Ignavibacteria bacterium]